jgi:hypothetical protein
MHVNTPKMALMLAFASLLLAPLAADQTVVRGTIRNAPAGTIHFDNGLLMSIAHDDAAAGSDKAMHLVVTFRSLTDTMSFVPGTLYNCGTAPSPTSSIELNLTESEGARHRHLHYLGDGPPYRAICAGQIIPFVAVLPHDGSISLPLDLDKYFDLSDSKKYDEARFHPGIYSLEADLTNGAPPVRPGAAPSVDQSMVRDWVGTVRSNTLKIRFEREFAAPVADNPR